MTVRVQVEVGGSSTLLSGVSCTGEAAASTSDILGRADGDRVTTVALSTVLDTKVCELRAEIGTVLYSHVGGRDRVVLE